jgi:hypothetical protein
MVAPLTQLPMWTIVNPRQRRPHRPNRRRRYKIFPAGAEMWTSSLATVTVVAAVGQRLTHLVSSTMAPMLPTPIFAAPRN